MKNNCKNKYTVGFSALKKTVFLLLAVCLFYAVAPHRTDAAIAFDAASNSTPSGTDVTSDSWNHTTGSGLTNSILIIGVTWRNSTTNTYDVSSITYGGSSAGITLIRKSGQDGDGISRNVALYYLKNPGSGSNQIVVNFSGTVWVEQCGAVTLQGVDQTNPIDAHNGQVSDSEDPVNVSVTTTVNNNWVVDVVAVRDDSGSGSDPAITADSSQTERFNRSHPGTDYAITSGMSTKGPNSSGSVSMEWDISSGFTLTAIAAVSLKPVVPTTLYRSVGTTATAVASGTSNALTISDSTATFGSALADGIGVGDVIQYDSDGNSSIDALAFIHGRTDSQTFTVKDKDGGTPTAVTGDNDWDIYRAYTSITNWEAGTENSNISEPTEDDVNPAINLVTANTILMVACYADGTGEMDDDVAIDGWTTGASNYIKIYTPTASSEVGTSQRHTGTAGTGFFLKPTTSGSGDSYLFEIKDEYVRLEGIEIDASSIDSEKSYAIIYTKPSTSPSDIRMDKLILHDYTKTNDAANEYPIQGIYVSDGAARITNSIVYNITNENSDTGTLHGAAGIRHNDSTTSYFCNNVVYNIVNSGDSDDTYGIYVQDGTVTATNNFVGGVSCTSCSTANDFQGSMTQSYNISEDSTASGTGSLTGRTATDDATPDPDSDWIIFANLSSGSEDFHLLYSSENDAIDNGSDPSASFSDDIEGDSRPQGTDWDIGADELVNDGSWYGSCWQYRKKLTVDSSMVYADLTDFPALISFTNDSDLAAAAQSDFDDVLFTSGDGITKLAHEIENFDGTNGDIVAWVKIPVLSSSVDTDIYMYYGCGTSDSQQNAADVWSNGYVGVWHLAESGNGTANEYKDSTQYGNHGQGGSGTSSQVPDRTSSGKISYGQDFTRANFDHIRIGDDSELQPSSLTTQAWVKLDSYSLTVQSIVARQYGTSSQDTSSIIPQSNSMYHYHYYGNTSGGSLTDGQWYHVVAVHDNTVSYIYVNGSRTSGTASNLLYDTNDWTFGGQENGSGSSVTENAEGILDEVRISSTIRPQYWIETEYNNQNNPGIGSGKFIESAGNEEEPVVFANLYEGSTQIAVDDYTTTVDITNVTLSKSFLVFSSTVDDNKPQCTQIRGQLYDSGSGDIKIEFERMESNGCALADIRYYVAEFTSGVNVQRGAKTTLSTTTTNVTLSPTVDTSKSFPLINGFVAGTTHNGNDFIEAEITANNNLQFRRNTGDGTAKVAWQVVEFSECAVQSGTITGWTTASTTDSLSPTVDLDKSWLIYSYKTNSGGDTTMEENMVRGRITANNQLTFDRDGTGSTLDLTWYLVEFENETLVQHGTEDFAAGDVQEDVTLSTAVNLESAFAFGGGYMRGGKSSHDSDDNPGYGWFTYDLTASNNLRIKRNASTGATADAGWFVVDFEPVSGTPTISSAANQTFTVGDGTTAISTITVTDDATTATITATDDIRIRIPSGFNMVWDTDDTTATIGGGASSKISTTVSYEDSSKTLVVDVTTDFAAGDTISISGLSFESFSAASSADNLELEVENDGAVTDLDIRTITINAAGVASISSAANQSFTVGDGTTAISAITITDDASTPTITTTNDIRIRIPAGFNMVWDNDTSATFGGSASAYVDSISYEDSFKTLVINLNTNFAADDTLTISDLSFESFSAASSADNLELEVENDDAVTDTDDKTITINAAPAACTFAKYKKITIQSSKVEATMTNFPVMITFTGDDLTEIINDVTDDQGDDIVFRDDLKGDQLSHEIEAYDDTSGGEIFVAWVKLPTVYATTDVDIYMYYGNDCITDATYTQDAAGVWSSGYEAVYHLHDDFNDSLASHNGTNTGSSDVTGQIADGQDFYPTDGADDINIGTWSVSGDELTIQAWIKSDDNFAQNDPRFIAKASGTAEQNHVWMLSLYNGDSGENEIRFRMKTGTSNTTGTTTLLGNATANLPNANNWYLAAGTYDGSTMRIIRDGLDGGSTSKTGNLRENTWEIEIGNSPGNTSQTGTSWDGKIDEVRISSKARSANWLKTEYNNQSDAASFLSVYGEQSASATAVSLVSFSAKGAGNAVNVEWQTAREFDNVGFHLYRASAPGGPYTRITEKLIPGFPQRGRGGSYSYIDAEVSVGQLYYYKLEDIDVFSTRRVHGPICVDWDGDGMPDDWEIEHGLNPWVDDADIDSDGDGLTNLEEYRRGLDPFNPDSDGDGILDGDEDGRLERPEDSGARQLSRGIEVLEQDASGMTLELVTSGFDAQALIVGGQEFERLTIAEYVHGHTSALGAPQLPLKGMLIDVPEGRVAQLTVLNSSVEPYYGYRVYPVPQNVLDDQGAAAAVGQQFVQDHAAYSADGFYPAVVAALGGSYVLREQIKQQLIFYPLSFNAASGQLNFYRRIKVRIDFVDAAYAQIDSLYNAPWQPPKATAALLAPVAAGLAASPLLANPISPLLSSLGAAIAALWSPPDGGGSAVYKIATAAEGIYRIDRAWLLAEGLDAAEVDAIDLDQVRLFNRGEEVAVYIEDQGVAGQLDGGDFIEFYAVAVAADYAKYTAENIYWLTLSGGAGLPRRMATIEAAPIGGLLSDDFDDVARHEQDIIYWLKAPGADDIDRWFSNKYVQGDEISGAPVAFTLNVPAPVGTGTLKIEMFGQVATAHAVEVVINGLSETFYWDDIAHYAAVLTDVPLNPGDNTVTLQCLSADGSDSIIVDFFEVEYRRDYVAGADNTLKFAPDSGERFLIEDFTSNSLLAYDISDPADVATLDNVVIAGANPYSINFEPATYGDAYLVVASAAINNPERLVVDTSSTLSDAANGADYILVTHREIGWEPGGNQRAWLTDLVDLRQDQGLRVFVADIEDIYDEFSFGINSPAALKEFLTYAYNNWQLPAPGYVLLVGDGTYDPKDLWLNADTTPYLPAYLIFTDFKGETVSDHWFVTISGNDAIADMYIGRLPAADAAQAATMVNKIIAYETTANTKFVDADAWEKNILLIADNQRLGPDYTYEAAFENMNDFAATILPDAMADPFKGYLADYVDAVFLTDDIIDVINDGVLMVNYSGHGATWIWAEEKIFQAADVAALTNSDKLPFFVSMSCEAGIFSYPHPWGATSLAEALLRSDDGAVAALMPTGMTTTPGQEILNNALFDAIFTDDVRTLGPAIAAAKQTMLANGDAYYEQIAATFMLFGDPATTLKVPLPYRPIRVEVERKSKKKAHISWNASSDCDGNPVAGYNIYRAATAAGPWSKINTELVTDTFFFDYENGVGINSGVSGGSGYYRVSAVDSAGDESAMSLAVRPAAALASSAAGSVTPGCFISTVQDTTLAKSVWLVVVSMVVLITIWFRVQRSSFRG